MPIDCLNPPCSIQLPISSIVSVFGSLPEPSISDCSNNLLYLTDEPGLVTQADPTSGAALSTSDRILVVGSSSEVDVYFSPCSRLYWELKKYFEWSKGELKRPPHIVLGYFDSANETLLEGLEAISNCFNCYKVFTHTLYDINNAVLFDTAESVDLAEWATLQETKFAVIPTVDYVNTGNQLLTGGYSYSANVLLNEVCIPELDDNCQATVNKVNSYDITHLGLAAVLSSISDTTNDYSFTVKFTPKGDAFSNLETALLNLTDTRSVTGVNPFNGGINVLSNQYTNVYHNVGGTEMYLEGLTSTGRYIDEIIHRIYIKQRLESDIFDLFKNNNSVSISDLSKLQNVLALTVRSLVSKNMISDVTGSLNINSVLDKTGMKQSNIFLQGNGWVILNYNTTSENLNSRISPTFIICYVRPGSMHFASIGLCQSEIAEV